MHGPDISTRQLRYLVAVIDWGSISQASNELGIAPPAIGQQIVDLEAKIGTALIARTPRGVRPTEAGKRVYAHARDILRQLGDLPGIAQVTTAEPSGAVHVGMSTSLSARLSATLFKSCRRRFPKITLNLVDGPSNVIREQVVASRLDFGCVFEDVSVPGLVRQPICRHRLFAVGARKSATGNGDPPLGDVGPAISIQELAGRALLFAAGGAALQGALVTAFRRHRLEPRTVGATSSLLGALAVANLGQATIVLPLGDPIPGHDLDNLVYLPIEPALWLVGSMVTTGITPLGAAAQAAFDLITEMIAGNVASGAWTGIEAIDAPPPPPKRRPKPEPRSA